MSSQAITPDPIQRPPMDFNTRGMRLNFSMRKAMNSLVSGLAILATVLVLVPLAAILIYLVYKGASSLNWNFFTKMPALRARPAAAWQIRLSAPGSFLRLRA